MDISKLPPPGKFGCAHELNKAVFKAINSAETNHLYNGRKDTVPTQQVVDLINYFKAATEHLEGLLPKPKTKRGEK